MVVHNFSEANPQISVEIFSLYNRKLFLGRCPKPCQGNDSLVGVLGVKPPKVLGFLDLFFQLMDGFLQGSICFQLFFDLCNGMDDCGMVSAAEAFADFRQGNIQ